jgi:hypothetical protein
VKGGDADEEEEKELCSDYYCCDCCGHFERGWGVAGVAACGGGVCPLCSRNDNNGTTRAMKRVGPIWCRPTFDRPFVQSVIQVLTDTADSDSGSSVRAQLLLTVLRKEEVAVPLFHSLESLRRALKLPRLPNASLLRTALAKQGFPTSSSHTDELALKTTAPLCAIIACLETLESSSQSSSRQGNHRRLRQRVNQLAAERTAGSDDVVETCALCCDDTHTLLNDNDNTNSESCCFQMPLPCDPTTTYDNAESKHDRVLYVSPTTDALSNASIDRQQEGMATLHLSKPP